jgi:hypothetical protein
MNQVEKEGVRLLHMGLINDSFNGSDLDGGIQVLSEQEGFLRKRPLGLQRRKIRETIIERRDL